MTLLKKGRSAGQDSSFSYNSSVRVTYGSDHQYLKRFCVSMRITEKFGVLYSDLYVPNSWRPWTPGFL